LLRNQVTLLRISESRLKHTSETSLESVRLKAQFLANMSHEIRTPMTGVAGLSEMLLDTPLRPEQREMAEMIQTSAHALLTVINDILDFSKIECGMLTLESVRVNIGDLVDDVIGLLSSQANTKGIELLSQMDSGVPSSLQGDPGRLRQVLTNLIGNALKFTECGEIAVRVTQLDESARSVVLRISVTDTGIGIAENMQPNLFQPYVQADGLTTRKFGGTGLGLAIARQLTELMGGEIGVVSAPGCGSTFWFTARLGISADDAPPLAADAPTLEGRRILIADDHPGTRRMLMEQTASWGMEPREVPEQTSALEALRAAMADNQGFDFAIVSVTKTNLEGFETVAQIRSDPKLADVRVLVLSPELRLCAEHTAEMDMSACLVKPVRKSHLFNCLLAALPEPPAETRPTGDSAISPVPSPLPNASSLRILLAEDNRLNQLVATRQLERLGYRPDVALNGREVLKAMTEARYDLVLMDCQMPEMDGFEATAEIRRREGAARHTHIIAMTAHALTGDRERCLAAGMDDYLAKPVTIGKLREALASLGGPGNAPASVLALWKHKPCLPTTNNHDPQT
jgi:CheY-like chemotaxis protein